VLSYDLCSVGTPAAVAEEYGGDPAIPADVARAYSEQSYVLEARQGAAAGCQDGFASQGFRPQVCGIQQLALVAACVPQLACD
jgi:hypothetical protein